MGDRIPNNGVPAGSRMGLNNQKDIQLGGPVESKYDRGVRLSDMDRLGNIRAYSQSGFTKVGNMLLNTVGTVLGQTIEGIGSITDGIANVLGADLDENEGLGQVGADIQKKIGNNPIYYDETKGWLSAGYILSNLPSIASTLSLMIPGMAVAKGAGYLARAQRLGSLLEKTAEVGAGAFAMRLGENKMESRQVFHDVIQDFSTGSNYSGANPDGVIKSPDEAKDLAKHAASVDFGMNWGNIVFDAFQMALVLKPVSGALTRAFGDNALTSTMDYGYKASVARGAIGRMVEGEAPGVLIPQIGKFQKALLKGVDVLKPVIYQTSEGAEEMWNYVSQMEGYRDAGIRAGTIKDDGSDVWDRIETKYMKDKNFWNSGYWGTIGGVVFQALGSKYNSYMNQKAITGQINDLNARIAKTTNEEEKNNYREQIKQLKDDVKHHGWWNNVHESVEHLAVLKKRQEDIADYMGVVNDPKASDIDKEIAMSKLKGNLFLTDPTGNSLMYLIQDLENPRSQKILANSFGLDEKTAPAVFDGLLKDAKWTLNELRERQGDTIGSLLKKPARVAEDVDLSIPGSEFDPISRKLKTEDQRKGFANPRMAAQLTFNNFMVKELTRINDKFKMDIRKAEADIFDGKIPTLDSKGNLLENEFDKARLGVNSRTYISAKSDLEALEAARQEDNAKLETYKEVGFTKSTIDNQQKMVDYLDSEIKRRKDALNTITKELDRISDDPALKNSELSVKELDSYTDDSSVNYKKIRDFKIGYFHNQSKKVELLDLNNQMNADEHAYEQNKLNDFRKMNEYLALKKTEQDTMIATQNTINNDLQALTNPEDETFSKLVSDYTKQYTSQVEGKDDAAKFDILANELHSLEKEMQKAVADGKFPTDSLEKFNKDFDRSLYQHQQAARIALEALMDKVYPAAKKQQDAAKATPIKRTAINKVIDEKGNVLLFEDEMYQDPSANIAAETERRAKLFLSMFGGGKNALLNRVVDLTQLPEIAEKLRKDNDDFQRAWDTLSVNKNKSTPAELLSARETMDRLIKEYEDVFGRDATKFNNSLQFTVNAMNRYLPELELPIAQAFNFRHAISDLEDVAFSPTYANRNPFYAFYNDVLQKEFSSIQDMINRKDEVNAKVLEFLLTYKNQLTEKLQADPDPKISVDKVLDTGLVAEIEASLDLPVTKPLPFLPETKTKINSALDRASSAYPSTNEQINMVGTPYLFADGRPLLDNRGRRVVNTSYPWAMFHDIAADGSTHPSFVDQSSVFHLKIETINGFENIVVYNNNYPVSVMDSVEHLESMRKTRINNLIKSKAAQATIDKKNAEFDSIIDQTNELWTKLRSFGGQGIITLGNPFEQATPDQPVSANTSGGSYFGNYYDVSGEFNQKGEQLPFSEVPLLDAFGENMNTPNQAIITIYYKGQYFVKDKNGDHKSVLREYPGMHVSDKWSAADDNLMNDGSPIRRGYNGFPVVLIPTHNKNGQGKHIYVPINLQSRLITDKAFLNKTGQTMTDRLVDILFAPQNHETEIVELMKLVGMEGAYNKTLGFSNPANQKALRAFYTTDNLATVFNKIVYVYKDNLYSKNDKLGIWETINYNKHAGISVFEDKGKTFLRFSADLTTNDPDNPDKTKKFPNSYYIPIFDDKGMFNAEIHNTYRQAFLVQPDKVKDQMSKLSIEVDPIAEIKKRLNESYFKFDFEGTTSRNQKPKRYKGLYFDSISGELKVSDDPSYLDYLSRRVKGVQSRVYGLSHKYTDNNGVERVWRSYFHNRQLWMNMSSLQPWTAAKETTAKTNQQQKQKEAVPVVEKAQPIQEIKPVYTMPGGHVNAIQVGVPGYIQRSLSLKEAGLIKVSADEKHYIIDEGQANEADKLYPRLHSYLPKRFFPSNKKTVATVTGDNLDALQKDFFRGVWHPDGPAHYNMSEAMFSFYVNSLRHVVANDQQVVGTGVVLWGTLPDGRKVAGEVDMVTRDMNGNLWFYDYKSSKAKLTDAKLKEYALQLNGYATINYLMKGDPVAGLIISNTVVASSSNKKGSNIVFNQVNLQPNQAVPLDFGKPTSPIEKYLPIAAAPTVITPTEATVIEPVAAVPFAPNPVIAEIETLTKEMVELGAERQDLQNEVELIKQEIEARKQADEARARADEAARVAAETAAREAQEAEIKAAEEAARKADEEAKAAEKAAQEAAEAAEKARKDQEEKERELQAEREEAKRKQAETIQAAVKSLGPEAETVIAEVAAANKEEEETTEEFIARAVVAEVNNQQMPLKGKKSVLAKFRQFIRDMVRFILGIAFISTVYLGTQSITIPANSNLTEVTPVQINFENRDSLDAAILQYNNVHYPSSEGVVIVDKLTAIGSFYDAKNNLIVRDQVITGAVAKADTISGEKVKDATSFRVYPADQKITQSGDFVANRVADKPIKEGGYGATYLWHLEEPGVHGQFVTAVHSTLLAKERQDALASPTPKDNNKSFGCIAPGTENFKKIQEAMGERIHVYVIPDSKNRAIYGVWLKAHAANHKLTFAQFLKDYQKAIDSKAADPVQGNKKGTGGETMIGLSALLAGIRRRRQNSDPITQTDLEAVQARIAAIDERLAFIDKRISELRSVQEQRPEEPLNPNTDNTTIPDDMDGMINTDPDNEEIDDIGSAMASVGERASLSYIDIIRDSTKRTHPMFPTAFNEDATALVRRTILQILKENRITKGRKKYVNREDLLNEVRSRLDSIIGNMSQMVAAKSKRTNVGVKDISQREIDYINKNITKLRNVISYLDWGSMNEEQKKFSKDFVGYFFNAYNQLVKTNIVTNRTNNNSEEMVDGDTELKTLMESNPGQRFVSDASIRINPKNSMNMEAKIMLSSITEYKPVFSDNSNEPSFKPVIDSFGLVKQLDLDSVIASLNLVFPKVNGSKLIKTFNELTKTNPVIYGINEAAEREAQKFKNVDSKKGESLRRQYIYSLSSILKQYRKTSLVRADIRGDKPDIKNVQADRSGIYAFMLDRWEERFRRESFNKFYDIEDLGLVEGTQIPNQKTSPKKQSIIYQTPSGVSYTDFHFTSDGEAKSAIRTISDLFTQIKKATEKGPIRLNFKFKDGFLLAGDTVTKVTEREAYHVAAMFHLGKDIIFNNKSVKDYQQGENTKKGFVFADTYFNQIIHNMHFLYGMPGISEGVDEKIFSAYHPVVYKMMAYQFKRLGIQLAENDELSWQVLHKLNSFKPGKTDEKQFQFYDRKIDSFTQFMEEKFINRFVKPLAAENIFKTSTSSVDEFGRPVKGQARVSITEPFQRFADALDPFLRHSSGDWVSYSTENTKDVNGNTEYAYVLHNTLSLLMNEINDVDSIKSGFLYDLQYTSAANNYYIQQIIKAAKSYYQDNPTLSDRDILQLMNIEYEGGSIINDIRRTKPNVSPLGIINLLEWSNYFRGENPNDAIDFRKNGNYTITIPDSTVMPKMEFYKNIIPLVFKPIFLQDGTIDFDIDFRETDHNGNENKAYEIMYSIFKAEIDRIYQATDIWNQIESKSVEQREFFVKEKRYIENIHYVRNKQGKISGPGAAVNFSGFGPKYFNNPELTGLFIRDAKGNVKFDTKKYTGNDDSFVREAFKNNVNTFLNDLINDAYQGHLDQKNDFYTVNESDSSLDDLNPKKISISYNYLNPNSVERIEQLFDANVRMLDEQGNLAIPKMVVKDSLPKYYSREWINQMNTEAEINFMLRQLGEDIVAENQMTPEFIEGVKERFYQFASERRKAGEKLARLPYAKMKYMIADRAINTYIFSMTMAQLSMDPAGYSSGNYGKFLQKYNKRKNAYLVPGSALASEGVEHDIRSIVFRDDILGFRKMELTSEMYNDFSESEKEYVNEFINRFEDKTKNEGLVRDVVRGKNGEIISAKVPIRIMDSKFFIDGARLESDQQKEARWKLVEKKMNTLETTNAGGYMTAREFFYRLVGQAKIDQETYQYLVKKERSAEGLSKDDLDLIGRNELAVKKFVIAGPNVDNAPMELFKTDAAKRPNGIVLLNLIKNAEFPLIKGWTTIAGSEQDQIREMLEDKEDLELEGLDHSKVLSGMILNAPSAVKSGAINIINLRDENGKLTNEIKTALVTNLSRDLQREQQTGGDHEQTVTSLSTQQIKYILMDMPFTNRYGKLLFNNSGIDTVNLSDEEKEDLEFIQNELNDSNSSSEGLSRDQMESILYRIFWHLSKRRMASITKSLGLDNKTFAVNDINKLTNALVNYGESRFGLDSNTVAYMRTEEGANELRIALTLNPSRSGLQSVLLSILERSFSKWKMPGGLFASTPSIGVLKSKVGVNNELRAPRLVIDSAIFNSREKALSVFGENERVGEPVKISENSWKVEYFKVEPGEAIIPWNFRDPRTGELLDYDTYVNKDGTPKAGMIDPEMLRVILNRVPNTGLNTSFEAKVVAFFPPNMTDSMAFSPEQVEVMNADHDYDKLYTYIPYFDIGSDGKLSKIKGLIAPSQVDANKDSADTGEIVEYVKRRLLEDNEEYQNLVLDRDASLDSAESIDDSEQNNLLKEKLIQGFEEKAAQAAEAMRKEEIANWNKYRAEYYAVGFYGRQTDKQLYNAIIDMQRLVLSDVKSLFQASQPLTTDTFHGTMQRKITLADGTTTTIEKAYSDRGFEHYASFWTNTKYRATGNQNESMISNAALSLNTVYLAQRLGLFYNHLWPMLTGNATFDEYESLQRFLADKEARDKGELPEKRYNNPAFGVAFLVKDNYGKIKDDSIIEADNSTIRARNSSVGEVIDESGKKINVVAGQKVLYTTRARHGSVSDIITINENNQDGGASYTRTGLIADKPAFGRYRTDRIYAINNKGEKVYLSDTVKSILQSFLDNGNEPINPELNTNPSTLSSLIAMTLLGYVDEGPLVLLQDIVKEYAKFKIADTVVNDDPRTSRNAAAMQAISSITGLNYEELDQRYNTIPKEYRNIITYLNSLISERSGNELTPDSLSTSEDELLRGVALSNKILPKDKKTDEQAREHELIQLKALRLFLLGDIFGSNLTNISINTNYMSGGLKNNIVEVTQQALNVNKFFDYDGFRSSFSTSIPAVGGIHRLFPEWQSNIHNGTNKPSDRSVGWKHTLASLGYSQGISKSIDLLRELEGANMFLEAGRTFGRMHGLVMGIGGRSSKWMNQADYLNMIKKLDVNFVSYMLSNDDLFEKMFSSPEEFEFFKNYGREIQFMPGSELEVNENYSVFNELKSLAALFNKVGDELDTDGIPFKKKHVIFSAFEGVTQVNEKWPSSIKSTTNAKFIKDLGVKIASNLKTLVDSNDPRLSALGKRLVLMAYQNGGIMGYHSIVQHIHPSILFDFNIDRALKSAYNAIAADPTSPWATQVLSSFAVQFYQHYPKELRRTVKDTDLVPHVVYVPQEDGTNRAETTRVMRDDKNLNGNEVITLTKEASDAYRTKKKKKTDAHGTLLDGTEGAPLLLKYDGALWLLVSSTDFTDKLIRYQRIGLLGYRKKGVNEYKYQPRDTVSIVYGESMHASNRINKIGFKAKGLPEIGGEFVDPEMLIDDDEDPNRVANWKEKGIYYNLPMSSRLLRLESSTDPVTLYQLIDAVHAEGINSDSGAVIGHLRAINADVTFVPSDPQSQADSRDFRMKTKVTTDPKTGLSTFNVIVNLHHPDYRSSRSAAFDSDFDNQLFIADLGHEIGHVGTKYVAQLVIGSETDPVKLKARMAAIAARGTMEAAMVQSVGRLLELHRLMRKQVGYAKSPVYKDFKKWNAIIDKVDAGERLTAEEVAFFDDNNYLRAFRDTANNNKVPNNEFNEFLAYIGNNAKMHRFLNDINFDKPAEGKKGVWETLKEILADILEFFGFSKMSQEALDENATEIKNIFKRAAYAARDYIDPFNKSKQLSLKRDEFQGDAPAVIQELRAGSALHVALMNILGVYDYTTRYSLIQQNAEALKVNSLGGFGASSMLAIPEVNNDNAIPVRDFIPDNTNGKDLLKTILKTSTDDFNRQLASRILLSAGRLPVVKTMTREELNTKFKDAKRGSDISIAYDEKDDIIYLADDLELNTANAENVILEETIHALAYRTLSSDPYVRGNWVALYNDVKEHFDNNGIKSPFVEDAYSLLNGVLRDGKFRQQLDTMFRKNDSQSLLSQVIDYLLSLFGMRKSATDKFKSVLDQAYGVLAIGSAVSADGSAMASVFESTNSDSLNDPTKMATDENEPDESIQTTSKAASPVGVNDFWGSQLTGNPLLDKYIVAHIEKIRAISQQYGKKQDKIVLQKIGQQSSLFKSFKDQIIDIHTNLSGDVAIIDLGFREYWALERRLDSIDSLDELGDNYKLLTAWSELAEAFDQIVLANNPGLTIDKDTQDRINELSGKALALRAAYLRKLVEVFKKRATAENVPTSVVAGIDLNMSVENIGAFAANFLGLSTGSNPLEQVADFLIQYSAYKTNADWLAFEEKSNSMFKKVNNNIDKFFFTRPDGRKQLQTRYSPELWNKLAELASEVSGYEDERQPLVSKLKELKKELTDAIKNKEYEKTFQTRAQIEAIEEEIQRHKAATKTWDTYMEFMRDNFILDIMKVTYPKGHPKEGTTESLRYSEMTDEQKVLALTPWHEYSEVLKEAYTDYSDPNNPVLNKLLYDERIARESPLAFLHWADPNRDTDFPPIRPTGASKWFAFKPNDNWVNSKFYDSLTANEKEVYDWFADSFVESHENIPQNSLFFGDFEEDRLLREFVFTPKDIIDKMKYLNTDVKNWIADIAVTKLATPESSTALTAPFSKREEHVLKFRSFKNTIIKDQGYYRKGETIPDDVIGKEIKAKIASGAYVWNDRGLLVNAKGNYIKKLVPAVFDPIKMFKDFKKVSLAYKYKKEVEDILTSSMEMVEQAKVQGKSKYGIPAYWAGGNPMSDRMASTINAYLYDKRAAPITAKGLQPGEWRVSIPQIIDTLNKYTRARMLGLNPASGVTNLVMGTINNYMYAGRNEFIGEKDLHWAYWKLKSSVLSYYTGSTVKTGDAEKIMLILKKFNLIGGFLEDAFVSTASMNALFNHLFIFQKGGEYLNQGALVLAMMNKEKTVINGQEMSLWDAYEVKDGDLVVKDSSSPYADQTKEFKFARAVKQIIKEVHGDYDPLNFKRANEKLLGRLALTFRTWMPMALDTRFGSYKRDAVLSDFAGRDIEREGRWNTLQRAIRGKGIKAIGQEGAGGGIVAGAGRLTRFAAGTIVSTFSRTWGTKVMGDLGLTKDWEKQNMAVMMKEAWWMLAISTLGVIAKNLVVSGGDDDDKRKEKFLTWFFNQTSRIENDLWYYYNPTAATQVLRDPIAVWSTLKQAFKVAQAGQVWAGDVIAGTHKDIYKTGFRKGNSKFWTQMQLFLPVLKQGQSVWSMWENMYDQNRIQ